MVLQSNLGKWHSKQVNWRASVFTFKWYSHLEKKVIWIISHREKTTCPLRNEEMKSPRFLNTLLQLKVDYKDAEESSQHYRGCIFYFIQPKIKKTALKHEQTDADFIFPWSKTTSIKTEGEKPFRLMPFSFRCKFFGPFSRGETRYVEDKRQWLDSIWICFPSIHS